MADARVEATRTALERERLAQIDAALVDRGDDDWFADARDLLYLRQLLDQRDALLADVAEDFGMSGHAAQRELARLRQQNATMRAALTEIASTSVTSRLTAREALTEVDREQ